jgi:hypothetical protein
MINPKAFGHRHHRFPLAVEHQPPKIHSTVGPLFPPRERHEHRTREVLQTGTNSIQLCRDHTTIISHPIPN